MKAVLLSKKIKDLSEVLKMLKKDPVVFDDAWILLSPHLKKHGIYVNPGKVEAIVIDKDNVWVQIYTENCKVFLDKWGTVEVER